MSEALPHRPSAWGAGPGRAPPYVRIMAMYMSCARSTTWSVLGLKARSDPTSGDGELLGPHAPSALLELSSLDPGLGARAQGDGRAASIARGPCRTRTEERSGCSPACGPGSVGHLVYLV